ARVDRLAETTALMRAYFAGGEIDVSGAHVNAHGFTAVPTLAHAPRIMLGGGSPRVLRMAGELADIVSLNFDNRSGRIGPEGFTSGTASRTDEKLAWVREGAGDRYEHVELEIASYLTMVSDDRDSVLEGMTPMFGLTPDELAEHPHTLVGSTDQIAETLVARRERFGIAYVTVGVEVLEAFAPVVEQLAGT
ncbi:MAG: LLM class flavin-dependent oxidoreductase, partial [Acidimicrobiia bacterium]|nr:LLM class flavin-dependent oxidoreductase [Acidimicrobiia bacterium]